MLTVGRLEKPHENCNDDGTVGELSANHPLDEIDFEFLQIVLCGELGGV